MLFLWHVLRQSHEQPMACLGGSEMSGSKCTIGLGITWDYRNGQIWKTQQWPQDWKRSVFIPIPKKGSAKECSNYHTIALISHASKVMLKILQARLQQFWTVNFQMLQVDLEKAEESEIKLPTSAGSLKKQENTRKTSTSALLTKPKPLTMWITTNCGKFWKRWEYLPPEKSVCRSKSNG